MNDTLFVASALIILVKVVFGVAIVAATYTAITLGIARFFSDLWYPPYPRRIK